MKKEEVTSLFLLAGILVLDMWELMNDYWPRGRPEDFQDDNEPRPDTIRYWKLIMGSPWWLVKTPAGLVEIGWRKRVIDINWRDTPIRKIITADETTKSQTMVHAWNLNDALKYLQALSEEMQLVASTSKTSL